MKKLLLILFLIPVLCHSQTTIPNYTLFNNRNYWEAAGFKALHFPRYGSTPGLRSGQFTGSGAVIYDTVAKKLKIYNGVSWNQYLDSAWKVNDTLLAVRYGTQIDTFDVGGGTGEQEVFPDVTTLKASSNYSTNGITLLGLNSKGDGRGGQYYWDAASTATADDITVIKITAVTTGRFLKIFGGTVRAAEFNIQAGSDMKTRIDNALANATVKVLVFDSTSSQIQFDGKITIPSGKFLSFKNGAFLKGNGGTNDTLTGGYIDCSYYEKCLDTSVRVIDIFNSIVSLKWFGGQHDWVHPGPATDNRVMLQRAIKSFRGTTFGGSIYAPGDNNSPGLGSYYYFSDSVVIDRTVTLFGDGMDKTLFLFDGSKMGLKLVAQRCYVRDLHLRGAVQVASNGFNSSTAIGLRVASNGNLIERVKVASFDGDGYQITGDVALGTNANSNRILHCFGIGNGRFGLYLQGGDANQCEITDFNATGNARGGVVDNSFLGNGHTGTHTASNVIDHPLNEGCVQRGDSFYLCYQDNINVEPGITPQWDTAWHFAGSTSTFFPPFSTTWSAATQYYYTASIRFVGSSQQGGCKDCYVETDQVPVYNSSGSMVIGGIASNYIHPGQIYMKGSFKGMGSQYFAALNPTSTNKKIIMEGTDLFMGVNDADFSLRFGWQWNAAQKRFDADLNGSGGSTQWLTNSASLGRSNAPRAGTFSFFFPSYHRDQTTSAYKVLSVTTELTTPATGSHDDNGDNYVVSTNDTTIAMIRRVSGAWIPIRSGNIVDTLRIPDFSVKVRSLFTGADPVVYNNGAISLRQSFVDSVRAGAEVVATVTTTNNTQTTIATIATSGTAQVGFLEATIVGIQDDGSDFITGKKVVRAYLSGGSVALGSITDVGPATEVSAGFSTADWTFTTSGTNILIRVTGLTSNNINWKVTYKYLQTSVSL